MIKIVFKSIMVFFLLINMAVAEDNSFEIGGYVTGIDLTKNQIEIFGREAFLPTDLIIKLSEIKNLSAGDTASVEGKYIGGIYKVENLEFRIMPPEIRDLHLQEYEEDKDYYHNMVGKK
ncbi:hypothetical protein VQ643_01750 [Pseudomonas sp. F1_0610]|uniref:hypothetical protein n=1 Tax=Pseudomonas sp. F1_0610 TaxID=3114284 RepID=UPI0039C166D5